MSGGADRLLLVVVQLPLQVQVQEVMKDEEAKLFEHVLQQYFHSEK